MNNPHAPAVQREAEEDWAGDPRKIAHEAHIIDFVLVLYVCVMGVGAAGGRAG
jgi:hypothetical protein